MSEMLNSKKTEHLRKTELFSSCSDTELSIITAYSSCINIRKGEIVFSPGDPGGRLFIIMNGEIVISKPDNENRNTVIARFLPGDCFGELDMLTGSERNAFAEADADARLLVFPGKRLSFRSILKKHPEVSARILHKFLMQISGRIRKTNSLVRENSPLIQELSRQVYRDKLTGLYNKTYLEEKLKEILPGASASGGAGPGADEAEKSAALIMLKPDNFKAINDTYGHEAGDQALRIIARALGAFLPETTLFFRFMGNELAVILPDAGRVEAAGLAEDIMNFLHELQLMETDGEGKNFVLSVSFGIAVYPEHASDSQALIQAAHELPLIGRAMGGNVILFPGKKE